ncbi:hypothetical protein ACO22_00181 [Paracoccidioides brasiliensis]|uniref:Uncharacterized protein n=1 Tax=Paracoccidioides brasiliensis TaxID=121759 RepID=A0A1D2JQ44_PARBR|nr:hypothetical protein ACO22_00181 [Paracoccidioides brasiliensis]
MAVIAVLFYAPLYISATMTGLRLIPQASTIQRQPTQAETVRTLFDAHVTSGLSTYSLVFVGDLQYIDPSDRQAPTNRTIEYVAFEIQAQVRR